MYAVAFDLSTEDAKQYHPKGATSGASPAYSDIREVLLRFGFEWKQGSLYTTNDEDMAKLFSALMALKQLPWFPKAVKDIRAFKVEQWSDFTALIKGP
jgi:virulence-associated protein VapD